MKLPLSWIREFVDVDLQPPALAHALTMAGIEVEGYHRVGEDWERVVVAEVVELERVPGTESLLVARVDDGSGIHTVVTGAPNLRVGDRVPWVQPGGMLPGGREIAARTFRGIRSEGMLCAADELDIGTDHDGIYILDPSAPLGVPLADYLDETVFEFKITPNRADVMNVLGVAREISALLGVPLRHTPTELPAGGPPVEKLVQVAVADPDLCPRYSASVVVGVQVQPSPSWMQRRLYLSGIRPISNVVDVTNYVMLELGQPLHAFDRARIHGRIIARRAQPGERLVTLDGQERLLSPEMLVIADEQGPQALAGIMGGLASEVTAQTRDVVIEAANFERRAIRRASRSLRLASEASRRFERGLDPEMTVSAASRAAALIAVLAGGTVASGIADAYPGRSEPRTISTTLQRIEGLLGHTYSIDEVSAILTRLGFEVRAEGGALLLTVPTWRLDVEGPADVAEEVARISGYEKIPNTLPSGRLPPPLADQSRVWAQKARLALVSAGLQEVMTYSLVGEQASRRLLARENEPGDVAPEPIRVANPLSPEHAVLRTTLLPSLLETTRANLRHSGRVCIFELARVYLPPLAPLPTEVRRLAVAMAGHRDPIHWAIGTQPIDFFDLKGALEAVFAAFALRAVRWVAEEHPALHPGQAARIESAGETLGFAGQVHPLVAERFELEDQPVFVAELDFEALVRQAVATPPLVAPPRYPGVEMDIAVVVDEAVPHAALYEAIVESGAPLLESAHLFDLYRGEPVPPGKKSMAYALTYRAPDRTLTEAEAGDAHRRIEQALRDRFGAQIRGR